MGTQLSAAGRSEFLVRRLTKEGRAFLDTASTYCSLLYTFGNKTSEILPHSSETQKSL
jgi:hypothetical protein